VVSLNLAHPVELSCEQTDKHQSHYPSTLSGMTNVMAVACL